MALLRCYAQTLLLVALTAGTCCAGFLIIGEERSAESKLRIQSAKQAAVNSYGPPGPCTPGTPQFPNYIQPMKIDPTRMMGKWYLYGAWFDGMSATRTTVNVVLSISNLLKGSLTLYPSSTTQAIATGTLFGTFRVANNTNQCNTMTQSFLDYLTVDGDLRGFGFTDGAVAVHTSQLLSTDYESYAVFFECDKYSSSSASGLCLDAYPYVYTRERQDKVSAATVNNINSAVNKTLGPYCFTSDRLNKFPWINDMPECPLIVPSDSCYVGMLNAYVFQADPNAI